MRPPSSYTEKSIHEVKGLKITKNVYSEHIQQPVQGGGLYQQQQALERKATLLTDCEKSKRVDED